MPLSLLVDGDIEGMDWHVAENGELTLMQPPVMEEPQNLFDRIIEIAVLRLDRNGETLREYVTLVNPFRDIGPTHKHGIAAGEFDDDIPF